MNLPASAAPVLYVEDDDNDTFLMTRAFARAEVGRQLVAVDTGQRAIDYLSGTGPYTDRAANPLPCLVLLDLNLPGTPGMDVLAWIRKQPAFAELPVVIFSSSEHPADRERARQLGATDYWGKPATPAEFVALAEKIKVRWVKG